MLKVNQIAVFREEFDNNSLLFDPVTGRAFHLNPVATFIWQELCLKHSIGKIETGIQSKFSNLPQDIKSDLDDFLRSLIDNGFVGNEI
jgi:hypothetical protein